MSRSLEDILFGNPSPQAQTITRVVSVIAAIVLLLLAVGIALLSALVQAIPAWRERRPPTRIGTLLTRVLLVSVLAWGVFAALFLPLRQADVRSGELVWSVRPKAFGEIPWPVPGTRVAFPGQVVQRVESVRSAATGACNGEERLVALAAKDSLELSARKSICPETELRGLRDASAVAALLERELHSGRSAY